MRLVCGIVGQRIDIGGEARGGRGVDPCDMVIDTCLFCASFDALLDEVNKIGRAEFSKACETICSCVDGKTNVLVFYDSVKPRLVATLTRGSE